jgi:CelD/BcsL family acetyltransferase involved in cellulose biosynthesis
VVDLPNGRWFLPFVDDTINGEDTTMTGASSSPHTGTHLTVSAGLFAPAWLPPGGLGNGLRAPSWAPIADIPARQVDAVLTALRDAHIPAHVAPAPRPVRVLTPGARPPGAVWRLRVGSTSYAKAESLLMQLLRELDG